MKKVNKNKNKILLLLVMLTIIVVSSIMTFSLSVLVINLLLGCVTIPLILSKSYENSKMYVLIFFVSIIFIFLVYFANMNAFGSPYYLGGSDDIQFEEKGQLVVNSHIYNPAFLNGTVLDRFDNAPFFSVYIAAIINFSNLYDGYNTFLPRFINVHLLIWIVMIFQYLIKKYADFTDTKTKIISLVFALTPNIQYINAHVFRDTLNLFQILMLVFIFEKLISNQKYLRKFLYLILLFILTFITFYTRENALVFAAGLCLLILAEKIKLKKRYLFAILVPIIMGSNFLATVKFDTFLEYYSEYVLNNTSEEGLSRIIFEQPLIPFGIILRSFYAFIIPFPNIFNLFKESNMYLFDFVMLLVYCGVLIQVLLTPFLIRRLIKMDWLALSFLICFIGIIATTFTFRHIIFYYPFMVALAIDGYLLSSKKAKQITMILSVVLTTMLGVIYIFLKIL